MSAKRANEPVTALVHLKKLPNTFSDYIYTQGQAVFIAEEARQKVDDKMYVLETKEGKTLIGILVNQSPKEFSVKERDEKMTTMKASEIKSMIPAQAWYRAAGKAALARMGTLNPKNESSTVIAMYFYAKLENAKYLYLEAVDQLNAREELKTLKKANDLSVYVKGLAGEFAQVAASPTSDVVPNGRISQENHDRIQTSMNAWLKYADLIIAETRFRGDTKDRFDQVLKATDKVVKDTLSLAKTVKPGDSIILKDYRVTGEILSLALRANVQKGNVEQGKAILDVLKRLSGPEGEKGSNPVAVLLNDIAGQIKRMTADKDPALKTTKGHYTQFLDEIAKEYEAKGYENAAAVMIAHAFNSLDDPRKAAQAFSKVKPGVDIEKKIAKKKVETDDELKARQAWEEENNRYWGVQIEYIRALRACKDKESIAAAEKATEAVLKHPNASYKIQAMIEKNLMDEDQQKYREAVLQWQQFMAMPALKNTGNPDVAKVYFTGYVHYARCVYKLGKLDPKIKDRPKLINAAAGMIVKLEFTKTKDGKESVGWGIAGPLFRELLKEEKDLRDAYEKAKAAQPKSGSWLDVPRRDANVDLTQTHVRAGSVSDGLASGKASLTLPARTIETRNSRRDHS
jgi:hypothetical protein